MNPENLHPPFKKGQSGNPRGRPKEPWREWLNSDRVGPILREQLLRIALDKREDRDPRARQSVPPRPRPRPSERDRGDGDAGPAHDHAKIDVRGDAEDAGDERREEAGRSSKDRHYEGAAILVPGQFVPRLTMYRILFLPVFMA
jgi:Family of unknown function (DUF5681)